MEHFTVQPMNLTDLEIAAGWAAREGWNPGLHDSGIFYEVDPAGFFIGKLGNVPVASISAVRYGEAFGFIGFYIVAPEYRDHGYGGHLIQYAAKHLEGCRSVGLDGVEAQQANYARHGAKYAHDTIRFEGRGPGIEVPIPVGSVILPLADIPFETLLEYDRRHFPTNREDFLRAWIDQPDSLAVGIVSSGKLTGFGVRRRCHTGYKIAPLFADEIDSASALFAALRQGIGSGESLFLDVPEPNPHAMKLTSSQGMHPVFHTARMYLGEDPELPLHQIYGITSFELG